MDKHCENVRGLKQFKVVLTDIYKASKLSNTYIISVIGIILILIIKCSSPFPFTKLSCCPLRLCATRKTQYVKSLIITLLLAHLRVEMRF